MNRTYVIIAIILTVFAVGLLMLSEMSTSTKSVTAQKREGLILNEPIASLYWSDNATRIIAVTNAGSVAVLDKTLSEKSVQGFLPADPLSSNGSIGSIAGAGDDLFLGGFTRGLVASLKLDNGKWSASSLYTFTDAGVTDPAFAAGDVSAICASRDLRFFVTVNYDGSSIVWTKESSAFKRASAFRLPAGPASAGFLDSTHFWAVTHDGAITILDVTNTGKSKSFQTESFGAIQGADATPGGDFLLFGASLEFETPAVAIYNASGQKVRDVTYSDPKAAPSKTNNYYALSQSFADAKWLDNNRLVAAKGDQLFIFEQEGNQVRRMKVGDIPQGESITSILVSPNSEVFWGTTEGQIGSVSLSRN